MSEATSASLPVVLICDAGSVNSVTIPCGCRARSERDLAAAQARRVDAGAETETIVAIGQHASTAGRRRHGCGYAMSDTATIKTV